MTELFKILLKYNVEMLVNTSPYTGELRVQYRRGQQWLVVEFNREELERYASDFVTDILTRSLKRFLKQCASKDFWLHTALVEDRLIEVDREESYDDGIR